MDYKKFIRSQKLRFLILKFLGFVPDAQMVKMQYRIKMGRRLNLKSPRRMSEWIQWYKVNYRNPLMNRCVDKYEVRKYVEDCGLASILNHLHGVYEHASEIDFSKLPERFIIKTTSGSGGENVVICKNKSQLDIPAVRMSLDNWLSLKTTNAGREWAYSGISVPRIIVEDLLEQPENPKDGLTDYKIFCFNGEPKFIITDKSRYTHHRRNIFTTDWKDLRVSCEYGMADKVERPKNLDGMLDIARKLSAAFPFVRVDLYNLDGKIYFGELTFYPWSGYMTFEPDDFDFKSGEMFSHVSFDN